MKKCDTWAINSPQKDFFKKVFMITKITIFIFFVAIGSSFAKSSYSQNTRLSLHMDNCTIQQVFEEIQKKSEFIIFYKDDQVNLDYRSNVDVEDATVDLILDQALKGSGLGYRIIDRQIVILPPDTKESPAVIKLETHAEQKKEISGSVKDSKGLSLPGVSVVVKGTTIGIITDIDGKFRLSVPTDAKTLVFSFVGMKTQEIAVNGRQQFDIILDDETVGLEEVVAIGYGTQRKSDVTGAVAQIKGDELKKISVVNLESALQGQAAGVYVSQSSGAPGAGSDVIIRGQTSVTGLNDVLYVVDGIPITGSRNNINPQDIESIEVLKDASAAAIYGSRASSGVILITTKRGSSKGTILNFDAFYGIQQIAKKIDMMNGREWAEVTEKAVSNALARNPAAPVSHNPDVWDAVNQRVREAVVDSTDWQDVFYRPAPTQNYNLSITGGNENSNIYVGIGYQRQDGIAPNSFFERYTARLNSDHKLLSGRLRLGNNLSLSYSNNRSVRQNNDYTEGVSGVLYMSPLTSVYKKEGSYIGDTNRFSGVSNTVYYSDTENPMRAALLNTERNNSYNIVGSIFADLEIIKNLTLHVEAGGEFSMEDMKNFNLKFQEYIKFNSLNRLSLNNSKAFQLQTRNFLTYKKSLGKHDFTLMAGTDMQDYHAGNFDASRTGFVNQDNPNLWYLGLGDALTATNNEGATEWAILSYYSRLNYAFNNKYLFTATIRRDGSSRFYGDNKWGNFPSFSAGWRISEESFMKGISFVNNLKLRAGWGLLGNERNVGNYVTASNMARGVVGGSDIGYIFGANQAYYPGARPSKIPNKDLTWEISDQSNIGLDAGFLNNRITFSADYFIKKTRDMILAEPLPVAGRGTLLAPSVNVGTLQNSGFEFEAVYSKGDGEFNFKLGLNLTTTRGNKITALANGVKYLDSEQYRGAQGGVISRSTIGQPIGIFYVFEAEGIFKSQEEITNHATQAGAGIGDYKFKDVNNDGVINNDDRTFMGNPWPLFVAGLKGNFQYHGFDINLFFQGSFKNDIFNTNNSYWRNTGIGEPYNKHRDYLDYYDPLTNPDGKYAAPNANDLNNNKRLSSMYIEDGSYLRLQNLQIGYSFPLNLRKRLNANKLRVYLEASNLFTITNYSGYNPDLGVRSVLGKGIDRTVYPMSRTFLMGVNLSL